MLEHWVILQDFFAALFDHIFEPTEFRLPKQMKGRVWMVRPQELTRIKLLTKIGEHFNVKAPAWLPLEDENVRILPLQPERKGTYFFSYEQSQVPLRQNLSHDDIAKKRIPYMTVDEYLLATAFHKFIHNEFLDTYTETILSESWYLGNIFAGAVYGFYQHEGRNPEGHKPDGYDGVCLFNGPETSIWKTGGLREVVLRMN